MFTTVNSYHSAHQLFDDTLNSLYAVELVAQKKDNQSYIVRQMLEQPDAAEFIKVTLMETDDHESRRHREVIPRRDKPSQAKTILAIWAFKRKRFPDGRINKWKA